MPNPLSQFASPRRSRRWLLLFSPFILLIALYTAFEWFIDPFPNSIWALRVLNTKYLVHVRADLTIDGEPLVMERTFRCFDHVDFGFLNKWINHYTFRPDGQAGDTIAGITSKGRVFALSSLDACAVPAQLARVSNAWRNIPKILEMTPRRMSRGELVVPPVFEIHGGRSARQVDGYYAQRLLLEGYHGVRLNDLEISIPPQPASPWDFLKDWSGYDWFGRNSWLRPWEVGRNMGYMAGFIIPIPKERWETLDKLYPHAVLSADSDPEYYASMQRRHDALKLLTTDALLEGMDGNQYGVKGLFSPFRAASIIQVNMGGLLPLGRPRMGDEFRSMPWVAETFIPCVYKDDLGECTARPEMYGVMIYSASAKMRSNVAYGAVRYNYKLSDYEIQLKGGGGRGAWYRHADGTIFLTSNIFTIWGRR